MKPIISIISLLLSTVTFAQVIIGDSVGTAADKTSVLLEFANTSDKGIVLPYVRTKKTVADVTPPTEGTIILDATSPSKARVKYYNGIVNANSTDGWADLSGQDANLTTVLDDQPNVSEAADAKVVIGDPNTTADGVLVLESQTKAMVLPVVSSFSDVKNPAPGMMIYIKNNSKKRLAVYNGRKWSFWKP